MSHDNTNTPNITQVQAHLMSLLASLCDPDNPMEADRAKAGAQVASVLVDTAKVSLEYAKLTGQDASHFFDAEQAQKPPAIARTQGAHNPFLIGSKHRLEG